MSKEAYWTNTDGLAVGYGTRKVEGRSPGKANVGGDVEQLSLQVKYADLVTDPTGVNSSYAAVVKIPGGCVPIGGHVVVTTIGDGATDLNIGAYPWTRTSNTIGAGDPNGFTTTAIVADTAGYTVIDTGLQLGATLGTIGQEYVVIVTTTATNDHTVGEATVVIEYLNAVPQA